MRYYYLFFALFLWCAFPAHAQQEMQEIAQQKALLEQDPENVEVLKKICFLYLHKADYDQAIYYGEKLFDIGYERQDYDNAILYAHICLGQANLMKGDRNAFNHLGQAQSIGISAKNDSALCSIYNGLGLYASNIDKDYYSAIHYFFQGIEAAKRCGYERLHSLLLVNLSGIYYLKRDPAGLKYSLEAYELGHAKNDVYTIYCSSIDAAYLYFLMENYEKALQYIKEAEFIMLRNEFYNQAKVYALYGQILTAQGDPAQALEYFEMGLVEKEKNQISSVVINLNGYAQALRLLNRTSEAIDLLKEAIDLSRTNHMPIYRDELLKELSACYESMGMYAEALDYQRQYHVESDSLFSADKERIISDLRVKYDMERHENLVQQQKMELLQQAKQEQLLIFILIVILTVALFFYYLYLRKNRFYRAIVEQNKEAIRRERNLESQIQELEQQAIAGESEKNGEMEKYAQSSLTEEKKNSLFLRLEKLMQSEQIYRDNLLTKEKVAERLDTNRTYLSQAINEQTNQTFTQYINRYRINEAVRLLSDPANDTPLKAISADLGFNSMTTFYKLFQNTVGMTPAQYKNKIQEISRCD
ncbi:AraC family transcriptional regulator [Parabacteroides sp. PFB2-10]|uniref:AraC family transcriptional regulator n=1 Tax=Parabacteroides sp. PFB2-10 TaxID=1742405 RepID=UPI002474BAB1|nr:AraC family transcriptional regulator [Parabacteroides sp. PFB2-10]MDL2245616.1 AraC family transcriptional regulator [Parabacteroides sp. OttesenSCG-928-J18]